MKCRVCSKSLSNHSDKMLLECIGNPAASGDFRKVLGWALSEGFIVDRGSDGGDVWFQFKGESNIVRTRAPERTLYMQFLGKHAKKIKIEVDDPVESSSE